MFLKGMEKQLLCIFLYYTLMVDGTFHDEEFGGKNMKDLMYIGHCRGNLMLVVGLLNGVEALILKRDVRRVPSNHFLSILFSPHSFTNL